MANPFSIERYLDDLLGETSYGTPVESYDPTAIDRFTDLAQMRDYELAEAANRAKELREQQQNLNYIANSYVSKGGIMSGHLPDASGFTKPLQEEEDRLMQLMGAKLGGAKDDEARAR